ncbi:MAG TPA: cytochrome c3 family protein [Candidatus Hydrogenedentes bacterium]|nr:cytochrome c3 family protein [Candidatus Hydrogenedentota bacterium]
MHIFVPIRQSRRIFQGLAVAACLCVSFQAAAIEDEECYFCHGEQDFAGTNADGSPRPLHVEQEVFSKSAHGAGGCTLCHDDIKEVPHPEKLKPVDCAGCHDAEAKIYAESLHGHALAQGDPLAPACTDCHGKHDILGAGNPVSRINPIHIPDTCGSCHAEDAPVAKSRQIDQHDILQHYGESIHGKGLREKGLTVTAVCTSCHTAHHVLPHTDPQSSIARENVVSTCRQCHALIEQVHRKVINGELWEKEPDKVPVCVDCHQPHEARRIYYDEGVSDKDCMACHAQAVQGSARQIPAVNPDEIAHSTHKTVRCAQCHTGATVSHLRPCDTIQGAVDCSICHEDQVQQHRKGIHGQLLAAGDADAPECLDCHNGHGTQSKNDPASPTFPKNVPDLCGRCHREGEAAAKRMHSTQREILNNYSSSIHGKGLLESGLIVTATCTSCHTAHMPLPSSNPASSVHPEHIADTCGTCHEGIEKTFLGSVHSPRVTQTGDPLPVCSTCHTAHTINRTDTEQFKQNILNTCGKCHEEIAKTYFDTYHGKVSKLGTAAAAKCYDCHGAHDILPITNPDSRVSRDNIVETCGKCHPGSHRRFAGYLTHATHHDPNKYPWLFFTFWGMTALLIGTFAFFGLHTLAWLPHSFREMRLKRRQPEDGRMVLRFEPVIRQMHFVLILTFFGLALTGMALKFSYMPWAQTLSQILGGFRSMGTIHRFCAVVMIITFLVHLAVIYDRKRTGGATWRSLLFGEDSLVPNLRDLREMIQTFKWFLRMGPRPEYGKWTYWEKFDYFAVFWGIAIIGSTGMILWFPEWFTHVLPGWFVNVATIIHSDEALLAVGFIFTIHFFNTHFRPEKFPMDMAMFTGRTPIEELKRERPGYYRELEESGELEKRIVPEASKELRVSGAVFGTLALVIGFSLVLFILWSMIFGYR